MPPRRAASSSRPLNDTPEIVSSGEHDDPPTDIEEPEEPANEPIEPLGSVPCDSVPLIDEPTASLTEAIMLMTKELRHREKPSSKAKAKEPDTFDGSDPKKLNNFIILCNLYFRSNPVYSDDSAKVNFALSYLRGLALEYFEPSILDEDELPAWMDNWSAFTRTLRTQFGPIDPTADAKDGIDNMKMQDNQRIIKYNVEFNRLAIRTGWDDSVL